MVCKKFGVARFQRGAGSAWQRFGVARFGVGKVRRGYGDKEFGVAKGVAWQGLGVGTACKRFGVSRLQRCAGSAWQKKSVWQKVGSGKS